MTAEVGERVRENLLKLKPGRMAELLDSVAEEVSQRGQTPLEFVDRLLEEEAVMRA